MSAPLSRGRVRFRSATQADAQNGAGQGDVGYGEVIAPSQQNCINPSQRPSLRGSLERVGCLGVQFRGVFSGQHVGNALRGGRAAAGMLLALCSRCPVRRLLLWHLLLAAARLARRLLRASQAELVGENSLGSYQNRNRCQYPCASPSHRKPCLAQRFCTSLAKCNTTSRQ